MIPLQPVSYDVYISKYQLKNVDKDIDDTYRRVAKALSNSEVDKDYWSDKFYWALYNGATPGGRILSNAGAEKYKSNTSMINCVVSGEIKDSIEGIMSSAKNAAMTLARGSGIGYCFSSLRPRGAYINGVGAATSGSLSFMEIFNTMCFTINSAGGRRGAQMATHFCWHPDIENFITCKQKDSQFRQFNLSVLITDDFIKAVNNKDEWDLYFPIHKSEYDLNNDIVVKNKYFPFDDDNYIVDENDRDYKLCKIYKTVKADYLWDLIATSTYNFSEPGVLFYDTINNDNNNWWCENLVATNPCVTADTRIHTQYGIMTVGNLYEKKLPLITTVDNRSIGLNTIGTSTRHAVPIFMTSPNEDVYKITTSAGYELKATSWHELYTDRGKIKLRDLKIGDRLLIQSGEGQFGNLGNYDIGLVIGMIVNDGFYTSSNGDDSVVISLWGENKKLSDFLISIIDNITLSINKNLHTVSTISVPDNDVVFIKSMLLANYLSENYKFDKNNKFKIPDVVWGGSKECVRGYLIGLFQNNGILKISNSNESCMIILSLNNIDLLKDVQILLSNFGIFSKIYKCGCNLEKQTSKNGHCKGNYKLIICNNSINKFMSNIGFLSETENSKYDIWVNNSNTEIINQTFTSKIIDIQYVGKEAVYDTTQKDNNSVIFNGIVSGQCGEQPLQFNSSCLLGSINLTKFIKKPFTDESSFNEHMFVDVVRIFTRMLDNVVEYNGLVLEEQQEEIKNKRRHGMGFYGLGSALAMMKINYGSSKAHEFTNYISDLIAKNNYEIGIELAQEKGMAPILYGRTPLNNKILNKISLLSDVVISDISQVYNVDDFIKNKNDIPNLLLWCISGYMLRFREKHHKIWFDLLKHGCRFTHATTVAPTGTTSLSIGNNASNGIEPSFSHKYQRNMVLPGKKSKEQVDVFSYEYLLYKSIMTNDNTDNLPEYFVDSHSVTPLEHIAMQSSAQEWVDSSISKTINCSTDISFEDFKKVYEYAYRFKLKGCSTFRFNPKVFSGVLVNENDLKNTKYKFVLENGETVTVNGNETIVYDGEEHIASNLFDALKEGYYGKF